jgi:hypothetical protein
MNPPIQHILIPDRPPTVPSQFEVFSSDKSLVETDDAAIA